MLDRRTGGQAVRRSERQAFSDVTDVTLSVAKGPMLRFITRLIGLVRSIAGMPDYDCYLDHLRMHHPDAPVPTPRAFYEDFLRARYGDGPTRCC
jgi:uncharacterized short protein YbdD (DUF466 family)